MPSTPVPSALDMLWNGVSIVTSVIIMIGIGVWLTHKGWFTAQVTDLFAKLVTHVALPCMTYSQLLNYYQRDDLLASLPALVIGYLSIGLLYALAYPLAHLLRIPVRQRGVFRAMMTFGNTIFIGLPINTALFGEQALPATLMYYLANTSLFWVVGVNGIQTDGGAPRAGFTWQTFRRILNPPLITFGVCIAWILLGVPTVPPLMKAASYVGNLVTPLALFFVGSMLYRMFRQGLRWQRGYGIFIFARFVLSPALIFLLIGCMGGLPALWRNSYLVQASMPCQSSCAIVAHSYQADAEYATGGITITTLLSMLTIPFFAMLTAILP